MNGNILYKTHGGIILKKIDVNSKVFYGSILFSLLCVVEIINHLIKTEYDIWDNIYIIFIICGVISFIATMIFVEKDSVGLEDTKFGLLLVCSSILFVLMFIGVL